jgi:adenosylcobinamide-GDP ribazoletransferase
MTFMRISSILPAGLRECGAQQIRLFFIALQFFTRLPIPHWVGFESQWLNQAGRYFPAVGIVVGAAAASVYWLASWFWPPVVAILLSTIAGIYLTGAFHEDGFADTCDGLGGGMTRQRVLEIMQDSRIGAYGAIGIGLLLALKCAALACLSPPVAIAALLAAHPLSRLASTALIRSMDYAKPEGKAKPLAQQMSGTELAIAVLTVLPVLGALCFGGWLPWRAVAVGVLAVVLTTAWLARKFARRIGGYTGDCLGAVQQVSEVAFYLALSASIG